MEEDAEPPPVDRVAVPVLVPRGDEHLAGQAAQCSTHRNSKYTASRCKRKRMVSEDSKVGFTRLDKYGRFASCSCDGLSRFCIPVHTKPKGIYKLNP